MAPRPTGVIQLPCGQKRPGAPETTHPRSPIARAIMIPAARIVPGGGGDAEAGAAGGGDVGVSMCRS